MKVAVSSSVSIGMALDAAIASDEPEVVIAMPVAPSLTAVRNASTNARLSPLFDMATKTSSSVQVAAACTMVGSSVISRLQTSVLAMLLVVAVVGCGDSSVEGKWVKTSGWIGWESIEFQPTDESKGFIIYKDGETTYNNPYEIKDGYVMITAGVLDLVGVISGGELVIYQSLSRADAGTPVDGVFEKQ